MPRWRIVFMNWFMKGVFTFLPKPNFQLQQKVQNFTFVLLLLTPSLVRRNVIAITNEPMQNISTVLPFIIIPTICKKRKLCLLSVHNELVTNWEKLHRWCSALFSVSNLIISGFQVGTHSPLKHDWNWKNVPDIL